MEKTVNSGNKTVATNRQFFNYSIGDDFILTDDIRSVPFFDFTCKIEVVAITICLKGSIGGTLDLRDYLFPENSFIIVSPGQTVRYSYLSDDFYGLFIIMSKRFTDTIELNIKDSLFTSLYLKENPAIQLKSKELKMLLDYYAMLGKIVGMQNNPNRKEMVRLMLQAFFFGMSNFRHHLHANTIQKSRKEIHFEAFYNAILKHHKESRKVGFYANKLCLTPQYLSAIIKDVTGKSAREWIDNYIIMEAKLLLKSTDTSIQNISDSLGFPNQSFFGKFFKQHTGMSPKEYR
jgi:AraC-like DNA-binding protein